MKEYIISRIKMTIETLVIVVCAIFLISKSTNSQVSLSVSLNTNLTKALDSEIIKNKQTEIYEKSLYNPLYTFTGDLTGYAGDCALCTGYLACPPRTNVLEKGIYYEDATYGNLRIVASSRKYQCGTIIRFKVDKLSSEPIVAIILDRGVGGNDIDLLTEDEGYAIKSVGRVKDLSFEVLRDGWKR